MEEELREKVEEILNRFENKKNTQSNVDIILEQEKLKKVRQEL